MKPCARHHHHDDDDHHDDDRHCDRLNAVVTIPKALGHATVQITLMKYAHAMPRAELNRLENPYRVVAERVGYSARWASPLRGRRRASYKIAPGDLSNALFDD
jgi:hypothetical protein